MWNILTISLGALLFVPIKAKQKHFVLTTTEKSLPSEEDELKSSATPPGKTSKLEEISSFDDDCEYSSPIISRFHVTSNLQFRYARTQVLSYVKNPSCKAKGISFTAVIPDSAFISNFSMIIKGKEYVAQVEGKEDAKEKYEEAVTEGQGAGLVSEDVRDSNKLIVAANVGAGEKVEFKLTYEEMLERKLGKYEYAIHVNPGQVVDDFKIQVFVNESLPIKSLFIPDLKQSNEIAFDENRESSIATVERNVDGEESKAKITFSPDKLYQEEAGDEGLSGQFVVEYEVDRSEQDNEVQVIDGYFVHFFTPENIPTLPKHVIFVLDISGSMEGEKINQLKDAMFTILDDMTEKDYFNIILFNSGVSQWDSESGNFTVLVKSAWDTKEDSGSSDDGVGQKVFVIEASRKNKEDFINTLIELPAGGGTNLNAGLLEGLKVAETSNSVKHKNDIFPQIGLLPEDLQSIIVFLSDGQATAGVQNTSEIKENIWKANPLKIPIYSLGFGEDADFRLIKNISTMSGAFSKQIYEGSDAALQLEKFFAEISSPLLSNVKFDYVGGAVDNSSVSESEIRTFFKGGEFVVVGKLLENKHNDVYEDINVTITGYGRNGTQFLKNLEICFLPGPVGGSLPANDSVSVVLLDDDLHHPCTLFPSRPPRSQAQNFLQKLHAFINIKQLLKKTTQQLDSKNAKESPREKAGRLALENNFVTELTSLLVVQPNEEPKINTLVKDNKEFDDDKGIYHLSSFPSYSVASPFSYNFAYDSWDSFYYDEVEDDLNDDNNANVNAATACSGYLSLYSKTYLRGDNVTYTEDTEELAHFDNKLVSVEVVGSCCWTIFTDREYLGNSRVFREGKYTSLVQVKEVLRKASSLRKVECID